MKKLSLTKKKKHTINDKKNIPLYFQFKFDFY